MIIVSSYKIMDKPGSGEYLEVALLDSAASCPICANALRYRDSRARTVKDYLGEARHFMLRRLYCERCRRLHTEIPDIIQPFKHYDSEAIQMVIDEDERAGSCAADDSTMRRWKSDMAEASADISQRMVSAKARETDETVPLIESDNTLEGIKKQYPRWLAFVMTLLINCGHKLCTRFAFCPGPTPVKVSVGAVQNRRKGIKSVEEVNDSG